MHLLRIDASIAGERSASRELGDLVESAWRAEHPEAEVRRRDLAADPIPATVFAAAVNGGFTPEGDRTPDQRAAVALAAETLDELQAADAVLVDSPLYNDGISQHLKAWLDLVLADPRAGGGSVPLLVGTPVVLVSTRGGSYGAGTPREGWDHVTGHLGKVLADLWGADLTVVERELTLVGVNPAMNRFAEPAAALHAAAREQAAAAGIAIARAVRERRAAGEASAVAR